jgi:hypothetical protein
LPLPSGSGDAAFFATPFARAGIGALPAPFTATAMFSRTFFSLYLQFSAADPRPTPSAAKIPSHTSPAPRRAARLYASRKTETRAQLAAGTPSTRGRTFRSRKTPHIFSVVNAGWAVFARETFRPKSSPSSWCRPWTTET